MFEGWLSLSDIKALQDWNVSIGIYFSSMFKECSSLIDITALQNWKVFNEKILILYSEDALNYQI